MTYLILGILLITIISFLVMIISGAILIFKKYFRPRILTDKIKSNNK